MIRTDTPISTATPVSFAKALNTYLRLENESFPAFAAQVKALTPADRQWYLDAFAGEGIVISPGSTLL
jgi:hypothetical protein